MYWRRGALYFLNLSWFSAFDFIKNMKYAGDRNLLRYMYARNYQNRARSDKVIAKIKWCSFLFTWYVDDVQRPPAPCCEILSESFILLWLAFALCEDLFLRPVSTAID